MGSASLSLDTPAAMPGDDLLFHRLSDSTIGAVGFHGRVRDGIGWVTDSMATKLWGRREELPGRERMDQKSMRAPKVYSGVELIIYHRMQTLSRSPRLSLMVGLSSANRTISIG